MVRCSENATPQAADFYTAKGTVEALIAALGIQSLAGAEAGASTAAAGSVPTFHPGPYARLFVGDEQVGVVGELHPTTADLLDLPRGVYLFEVDGEAASGADTAPPTGGTKPRAGFPGARDLAVVVDTTVPSARIEQILLECVGNWGRPGSPLRCLRWKAAAGRESQPGHPWNWAPTTGPCRMQRSMPGSRLPGRGCAKSWGPSSEPKLVRPPRSATRVLPCLAAANTNGGHRGGVRRSYCGTSPGRGPTPGNTWKLR